MGINIIKYLLITFAVAIIIATLLPLLFFNIYWTRILDFLRIDFIVIGFAVIVALLFLVHKAGAGLKIILGLLSLAIIYQVYVVSPYTFLADIAVKDSSSEKGLSILVANVLEKNQDTDKALEVFTEQDADILLVMETNSWWLDQLDTLHGTIYPYMYAKPLDNQYGMVLFSKYELKNHQWREISDPGIPSIHGTIHFEGTEIKFHGMHPKPPRLNSDTDIPLLKITNEVGGNNMPAIVAGDMNDVGWSKNMRKLRRQGNVEDPRVGRWFYNTFHSNNPLMFWPLDYVLVTPHFKLVKMHKTEKIGSDHYPFYIEVSLE